MINFTIGFLNIGFIVAHGFLMLKLPNLAFF